MLKPWTITPNHEDLFIQRYDHILSWSLKITGHNRQLAEDLVHDAFYRAWRFEPSAKLFATLVGNIEAATVSVGAASYVIEYRGQEMTGGVRLIRASLTINRTDLRTI
jgi:hypothetical protein